MKKKFDPWKTLGNRRFEDLSPEEKAEINKGMRKNHRLKKTKDRKIKVMSWLKANCWNLIGTITGVAALIISLLSYYRQ